MNLYKMETPTRHILGTFENALTTLRNDVLMMASLTERNLRNAMQGLLNRDSDSEQSRHRRRRGN